MPAPRPATSASPTPAQRSARPRGRHPLNRPPDHDEVASERDVDYINAERLRAQLREMNP
jgi:hypothetical protein